MKIIWRLIYLIFAVSTAVFGEWNHEPMIPILPVHPDGTPTHAPVDKVEIVLNNESDRKRILEKIDTLELEVKTRVYVPLEIISDVEIEATLVDDQEVTIPFNIETNREPDKKDYYRLKFSEDEVDIDGDGMIDTYIYSPKYLNSKIIGENSVNIKGARISKEGTFYRKIYLTIEVE